MLETVQACLEQQPPAGVHVSTTVVMNSLYALETVQACLEQQPPAGVHVSTTV